MLPVIQDSFKTLKTKCAHNMIENCLQLKNVAGA